MKKTAIPLLLLLILVGCQKNIESITQEKKIDDRSPEIVEITKKIAQAIAGFSNNLTVSQEVFEEVKKNNDLLRDEIIAFDEFDNSHQLFNNALEKAVSYDLLAFMQKNDLEIYWPYSQFWDKKTPPTIGFLPALSKTETMGFVKDGENLKEVLVNSDYAQKKPVWIIRKKEIIDASVGSQPLPTTNANTKIVATAPSKYYSFRIKAFKFNSVLNNPDFLEGTTARSVYFYHFQTGATKKINIYEARKSGSLAQVIASASIRANGKLIPSNIDGKYHSCDLALLGSSQDTTDPDLMHVVGVFTASRMASKDITGSTYIPFPGRIKEQKIDVSVTFYGYYPVGASFSMNQLLYDGGGIKTSWVIKRTNMDDGYGQDPFSASSFFSRFSTLTTVNKGDISYQAVLEPVVHKVW